MIKNLLCNRSIRNSLILAKGYVGGQAILLLLSPVLTRIYAPEEFGVFAIFSSLLGILCAISGFRYELAIALADNERRARAVSLVNNCCIFISAILIGLFFIVFSGLNIKFIESIRNYLWILVVGVIVFCLFENLGYWGIRLKRFSEISNGTIINASTSTIVQLLLGVLGFGPVGLVIGFVIGKTLSAIYLCIKYYSDIFRDSKPPGIKYLCQVANRYRRFPAYSMWQALANTASTLLPAILFASYFSTTVAGLFLIAQRFSSMPLSLIGRSLGQVYFSEAIDLKKSNTDLLTLRYVHWLAVTLVVPFVLMGVYAPNLFELVFGKEWRQAGVYVTWMIPWIFVQCLVSPISNIVSVKEAQLTGLCSQLVLLVLRISPIFIALKYGSHNPVIWFSVGSYFGYLQRLCVSLYIAGVSTLRIVVYSILIIVAGYIYLVMIVWN